MSTVSEEIEALEAKISILEVRIESAERDVPRDRDYIINLGQQLVKLMKKENILQLRKNENIYNRIKELEDECLVLKKENFEKLLLHRDDRVAIFSASVKSSKTPQFDKDEYWWKCLCCGYENIKNRRKDKKVTPAHLIVQDKSTYENVYKRFGREAGYLTDFDGYSERNHIPLCGTLGEKGSCHDAFDTFKMTLVYDPFTREFKIYWPRNPLDSKVVTIPCMKLPYRRILCWRARHDSLRNYDSNLLSVSQVCEFAKCSEVNDVEGQKPSTKKRKQRAHR